METRNRDCELNIYISFVRASERTDPLLRNGKRIERLREMEQRYAWKKRQSATLGERMHLQGRIL